MPHPLLTLGIVLSTALAFAAPATGPTDTQTENIDYTQLLQSGSSKISASGPTGFRTVTGPRELQFPQDHGPHPAYRLEWWYISGQLRPQAANNRDKRWGFQLTFFRLALEPDTLGRTGWQSPHLYMAHFAISDEDSRQHIGFERLSRTGAGLAGTRHNPVTVWLENWHFTARQKDQLFPAQLVALASDTAAGTVALNLTLNNSKPAVLQGDRGYSPKSAAPGNASHYYSYTRLRASGKLQLGKLQANVEGEAWLDHEWSTSSLDQHQTGWDWFSLQLDDGRDLMFYRLRQKDGKTDPFSRGVLVAKDGSYRPLLPGDIEFTVLEHWQSPGGSRYPVEWKLRLPKENLTLRITPLFEDQEWRQRLRYWEGAVTVDGSVPGHGYLELSGY